MAAVRRASARRWGLASLRRTPAIVMSPESASMRPFTARSVVDLPEPLAPRNATTSPACTRMLMSLSTTRSPKLLEMACTSSSTSAVPPGCAEEGVPSTVTALIRRRPR
ncbi:hypothetical protein H490_0108710 [Leucobacter sp. UCD-THU]|nr:hypothetical protein H490_0108710 [Leucobacter sp. UCD-THU]